VQVDKEPATGKQVKFLMNEILKRRPSEGIDKKITGKEIAAARGGMNLRKYHFMKITRAPLKKEDIIWSSWGNAEKDKLYKIKDNYKQIVTEWVKSEKLWIKEEIE
jgi:hypothetical protein